MKDVSLAVCHKAVCCCVIDWQSELPLYPWEHAGYSHTFFFFFFLSSLSSSSHFLKQMEKRQETLVGCWSRGRLTEVLLVCEGFMACV